MRMLAAFAVLAVVFAGHAEACTRAINKNGGNGQSITIVSRNPPVTNPPSPAPTPPPPPPPIPEGWVPAPPRPPVQQMTRTNCDARVQFIILAPAAGSATSKKIERKQVQERWVYTCRFQVYVEVEVQETNQPSNCACGLVMGNQPNVDDPNMEKAYSTSITHFSMVAFDSVRYMLVGVFSNNTFENLKNNPNTTSQLTQAASGLDMDYRSVVQGFSGRVKALKKKDFPTELQEGHKDWTPNHVPAMCFTVEQKYISTYKWPQPAMPVLYTTPNVWVSQCYPFHDWDDDSARKRQNADAETTVPGAPNQRYWFKDFLLFPVGDGNQATASGFTPKPRYITSFYLNSNCIAESGVVSFDREFKSTIEREDHYGIYGAFAWTREYTALRAIGGVPIAFSNTVQFYALGHTKVEWRENYSRESGSRAFRPGVMAHALLGTPEVNGIPFIGAKERTKLCESVPNEWLTCQADSNKANGCADVLAKTYNEGAYTFAAPADVTDKSFSCKPAVVRCDKETTFLSFQNFGALARDYSKRADSVLLTGPRSQYCLPYPLNSVFSSLQFRAYNQDTYVVKKRDALQAAANADEQIVKNGMGFDHDQNIIAQPNAAIDEAVDTPHDVVVKPATGSAGPDGRPAGDHPLQLFPETYTVPVTLDPRDTTFDNGAKGSIFDGTAAPCLEGSKGCTCRTDAAARMRPACDAPLECNTDSKFCEPPSCIAGNPGCACLANSQCAVVKGDVPFTLGCTTDNVCKYVAPPSCSGAKAGSDGCECSITSDCKGSDALCSADGYCLRSAGATVTCTPGSAGCTCDAKGACGAAGSDMYCNEAGVCAVAVCNEGTRGCRCNEKQCEAGFECSDNNLCKQAVCEAGQPGCPCTATRTCSAKGFACKDFKKDGSDARCVAEGKNCSDQTDRCIKFCGEGKVLRCPPCSNQQPQCAGVAHLVPSVLVALALAVLAVLF